MKEYRQIHFTGERALFAQKDVYAEDCIFENGESPLKHGEDLKLFGCMFRWKYPLWYCNNVNAEKCTWFDTARAGVWYSDNVTVHTALIGAPKNFRRCRNLTLRDVSLSDAKETLWSCDGVTLENVTAKGDYFAMNSSNIRVNGFSLDGNYSFDGVKNAEVRNARMLTKDAFWNSENVTVYDSFISGEYLGWNSKNLTFVNCVIESLQGMCYIENLRMIDCKLLNTTLAFEYSEVEAQIDSCIESVLNPKSGTISARQIGELIIEKDRVDPSKTVIVCSDIAKRSDRPEWLREKE